MAILLNLVKSHSFAQCDILRQTSGEARDELTEACAFPGHRCEQTWHSEYDLSLRKDLVMR